MESGLNCHKHLSNDEIKPVYELFVVMSSLCATKPDSCAAVTQSIRDIVINILKSEPPEVQKRVSSVSMIPAIVREELKFTAVKLGKEAFVSLYNFILLRIISLYTADYCRL